MPRAAETPGKPAKNRVQILLNDDDMADLDAQRGTASASSYGRELLRKGLANHRHTAAAGTVAPDGHTHQLGKLVADPGISSKPKTYRCTGCDKHLTH